MLTRRHNRLHRVQLQTQTPCTGNSITTQTPQFPICKSDKAGFLVQSSCLKALYDCIPTDACNVLYKPILQVTCLKFRWTMVMSQLPVKTAGSNAARGICMQCNSGINQK